MNADGQIPEHDITLYAFKRFTISPTKIAEPLVYIINGADIIFELHSWRLSTSCALKTTQPGNKKGLAVAFPLLHMINIAFAFYY